jgi:hypothetical protein
MDNGKQGNTMGKAFTRARALLLKACSLMESSQASVSSLGLVALNTKANSLTQWRMVKASLSLKPMERPTKVYGRMAN